MKTFTYNGLSSPITPGIRVHDDERLGKVVRLGVDGRGRKLTKIKLDGRNPPLIEKNEHGDFVLDVEIVKFEAAGHTHHALRKPAATVTDPRILLWAHAHGPYTRGCSGGIMALWGAPKMLADGWDAWGDAGRLGTIPEALWILSPGDILSITHAGGYKSANTRVWYRASRCGLEVWKDDDFYPALTEAIQSGELSQKDASQHLEIAKAKGWKRLEAAIVAALSEGEVV